MLKLCFSEFRTKPKPVSKVGRLAHSPRAGVPGALHEGVLAELRDGHEPRASCADRPRERRPPPSRFFRLEAWKRRGSPIQILERRLFSVSTPICASTSEDLL